MASKIIGTVVTVKGSVEVRSAEGIIKVVSVGDQLHADDTLITGVGAEVGIDFISGSKLIDTGRML